MKVAILFPRLDVTFKEGPVPQTRGEIPPIRIHWQNMGDRLLHAHRDRKSTRLNSSHIPLSRMPSSA